MGTYLNPSSINFKESINSEIYVDKSLLISFTNKKVQTSEKYLCVSRPRRFGKTMAADMLAAYYGSGENTDSLFVGLKIASEESYRKYLNCFDVIKLDMQSFLSKGKTVEGMIELLTEYLVDELIEAYPQARLKNSKDLSEVLNNVFAVSERQMVILIDEWDCVMRRSHTAAEQKIYLDFLRDFLKNQPYVALAYMTGILPIKKYGEHSTLNMFEEYSMIQSHRLVPYFGFTEEEVEKLCERYHMDFSEAKEWYDGYRFTNSSAGKTIQYSIYSPRSVVSAMQNECFDTYWTQTETYEALKEYIQKNYQGLKEAVTAMIAGNSVQVNTRSFQNDMNSLESKDDVLTLLVHLGYLSYDPVNKSVSIPNKEVEQEFMASIEGVGSYSEIARSVKESKALLEALWNRDEKTVAEGIEKAHQQFPAINYNNENALSCVIELAFYYAREYYTIIRELPAGKGYADVCFLPKKEHADKPAVIMELKWDKSAEAAIEQIKQRDYPDALKAYQGDLLLCGINYSKSVKESNKQHQCTIERFVKE